MDNPCCSLTFQLLKSTFMAVGNRWEQQHFIEWHLNVYLEVLVARWLGINDEIHLFCCYPTLIFKHCHVFHIKSCYVSLSAEPYRHNILKKKSENRGHSFIHSFHSTYMFGLDRSLTMKIIYKALEKCLFKLMKW